MEHPLDQRVESFHRRGAFLDGAREALLLILLVSIVVCWRRRISPGSLTRDLEESVG